MDELYDFCSGMDSPEYLAHFVRQASTIATVRDPEKVHLRLTPAEIRVRRRMVNACETGERLDPENAFFPAMKAGVLYSLDDREAARKALLDASTLKNFDDYAVREADIRTRWFQRHTEYRGSQTRIWADAATSYPHIMAIRSIAHILATVNDLEIRAAVVRLGDLIMRKSATTIGILIGRNLVTIGLDPGASVTKDLSAEKLRSGFGQLASNLTDEARQSAKKNYTRLTPPLIFAVSLDQSDLIDSLRPIQGGATLLAVPLAALLLGFGVLRSRSQKLSAVAPFFAWLLVIPAMAHAPSSSGSLPFLGGICWRYRLGLIGHEKWRTY